MVRLTFEDASPGEPDVTARLIGFQYSRATCSLQSQDDRVRRGASADGGRTGLKCSRSTTKGCAVVHTLNDAPSRESLEGTTRQLPLLTRVMAYVFGREGRPTFS